MGNVLLSPKGRVSFPEVWEPKAFKPTDKPKFSVTLLFNVEEMDDPQRELLRAMKAAADECAMERFKMPIGKDHEYRGQPLASPFHKSEEKPEYYSDFPGWIYVKFSSFRKPGVVGTTKTNGEWDPIEPTSGEFYPGCWARVSYDAYSFTHGKNHGVAFGLRNIQKVADDDSFSGSMSTPEDDFGGAPAASAPADEIPF